MMNQMKFHLVHNLKEKLSLRSYSFQFEKGTKIWISETRRKKMKERNRKKKRKKENKNNQKEYHGKEMETKKETK